MTIDLYVDTWAGQLVTGPSNTNTFTLPALIFGDTLNLRIFLLARTPTYPLSNPFTNIPNAGLTMKVGIGTKQGLPAGSLLTQQFTWDTSTNPNAFIGTLPLNTTPIGNLIGSGTSAPSWFEIEISQSGNDTTVYQDSVNLQGEVISTASLITPPGLTAMSSQEANAIFLKNQNTGFILVCPTDNTKRVYVYVGTDGVVHMDPVT